MELGKAKYGSGKTTFKIADGDNVYRILPPMGKLAKSGKWSQYYRVEWGFKNSAGRNRPFQDVRKVNYQNQMVEVESAAHLQREALVAKKTELVAKLRSNPTDAVLKQKVGEVTEDIKRYNLDAKYYVNAISLDGKIGLLKLGSRAFKALKAEIDTLRKSNIDPLSVETGRFFNFRRTNETGNFQDTAYQVTVYKESVTVNGETYEKAKNHVLDQGIIDRLSDEAFELSGMYPVVTAAQVERMVKEGPSAVDLILGSGSESNTSGATDDTDTEDTGPSLADMAGVGGGGTSPGSTLNVTVGPVSNITTAVNLGGTGSATTALTAAATPTLPAAEKITTTNNAAASTTTVKSELSEDAFLRSIGALK